MVRLVCDHKIKANPGALDCLCDDWGRLVGREHHPWTTTSEEPPHGVLCGRGGEAKFIH